MKNQAAGIFGIGAILLCASAVYAQEGIMSVDVPFAFYVGKTLMPEGSYRVFESSGRMVNWVSSAGGADTKAVLTIPTVSRTRQERPNLVFHRYGEDYFLSQIWSGTGTSGRALNSPRREQQLVRSGVHPTLAVIAAKLPR
jgi:hypothetical protein